ncbi:outer membrane beta-barrel protein [Tenacibaculum sp. AHE15PA]|uniref:outer membrane beta-barrel protein n=1 Tax=unclassified Tenacibaculum TaxID=2635139 RepID=UPI001C4E6974|nr:MULTISPECIES: outer membrane beta-barrel protein [unclassified Tenacibaculum]QXP73769.1 outer membrane beta-barrel protein [Tenacibaculum sp. AHE14PA]QXP75864.1 outer membrane beta-barrel protein [Tenacibaculum sp. AHE15PA]
MNRIILSVIVFLTSLAVNAQFYVSASNGYSFEAAGVQFGTKTTTSGVENTYGSYGEGSHFQLRTGYFFNKSWGIEIAGGYLNGADQSMLLVDVPNQPFVDVKARGRAFGLSVSTVYNITENFYGRAGILTKVGGKTELVGKVRAELPAAILNPAAPAGATVPLNMDFTRDFKGKFPIGFIGAIGYKHAITKNLELFGEVEYLGISVTRDVSEIGDFTATIAGQPATRAQLLQTVGGNPALLQSFGTLLPLINDKISYEDSLTLAEYADAQTNPLARKQLAENAPYSSWGLNIGITYIFGKRK